MQRRRKKPELEAPKRILIVDDEAVVRELLQSFLEEQGYLVTTTGSGIEGIRLANKLPIHLILTDMILADSDGLEVLGKLKKNRPGRPVILMSGFSEADKMFELARQGGATACVSKTTPLRNLLTEIQNALNPLSAATSETSKAQGTSDVKPVAETQMTPGLESTTSPNPELASQPAAAEAEKAKGKVADLPDQKAPAIASLMNVAPGSERFDFGLEVFSRMLSACHPNVGNTAVRAVTVCHALGEALELPAEQRQDLLWAAALHDIGLVRLERKIVSQWLRHPEKITKEALLLVKRHPEQSREMLEFCPVFKTVGEIIAAHHEHWDGSGFPAGLRMEMIPWLARLLSVVVQYCSQDTPTTSTIQQLNLQSDKMFDPRAVEAVTKVLSAVSLPSGEREMLGYQLKPGMILAADIYNWDGLVIVGKGTELNGALASKIYHMSAASQVDTHVLVCC